MSQHLLGSRSARGLDSEALHLVLLAEAVDHLLLRRGWVFARSLAGPGTLSWFWPPSGSPVEGLYVADEDAHELHPCTAVGLYVIRLAPTDLHVVRAGDCTHSPGTRLPIRELPASLDDLEDYRFEPAPVHVC